MHVFEFFISKFVILCFPKAVFIFSSVDKDRSQFLITPSEVFSFLWE